MNKLLSKLKGDLGKANELIQESNKIVSYNNVENTPKVGGDATKEEARAKVEEQDRTSDM